MMTQLSEILKGIDVISTKGELPISIAAVSFDSRKVSEGDLYVAVKGSITDGHSFIGSAIKAGASCVMCEKIPEETPADVGWIVVKKSALALALAAANYYGNPSSRLKLVGVTGTNGKTTIATLLYDLYINMGYPCGLISTVKNVINGRVIPATHTTPDPVMLNFLLSEMAGAGCEYAFMEVSSHAVVQDRISGLTFSGALFTNITHDHLDYHRTFSSYLAAKKGLFDSLGKEAFALVNADDRNGQVMLQNCRARKLTFSMHTIADYKCRILENRMEGFLLRIGNHDISTFFVGKFNAYNLLSVYAVADCLGSDPLEVLTTISKLRPVEGRMEVIHSPSGPTAIVDYAHTPDALANVISTMNEIKNANSKLITVVGAGGDRDRTKRPEMAKIAAEGSEKVILTSDNPRSEDPDKIIDEMISGLKADEIKKTLRITNRREAIRTAVMLADREDIILVAGKGHETYQEVKGERSHFDDREELKEAFGINKK